MKNNLQIFAISRDQASCLVLSAPTGIGGSSSSGRSIKGLKDKDDYVIVSPSTDCMTVHPLKGSKKTPVELKVGDHLLVGDLTLLVTEGMEKSTDSRIDLSQDLSDLVHCFSETDDLMGSMQLLLEKLLGISKMDKGLVINKNLKGDYEIVAQKGVNANDPWLSESLVLETLNSNEPRFVQNIVGSRYESKKSLVATGFISLFAWPLVVRGETHGVLLIGSAKPHSGLSQKEKRLSESYTRLGALMLNFYLRDLKIREEVNALKKGLKPDEAPLLTESPQLIETLEIARKVAKSDLAVLVQGETGVGKELLASWIHKKSDRSQGPFIAVNCGAIPSELLESLLFGHKKGAFTGAHSDQIGKFQAAHRGTIFLDEIGDLPGPLQVKLLRVLQEKSVESVGSTKSTPVDVRVVTATHQDVTRMVNKGTFRQDLYYRIAEMTLLIPPLRERRGDILTLATQFLKTYAPEKRFSQKAWEWLKHQEWKGNVRELMSTVKRASILSTSGEIQVSDLKTSTQTSNGELNWLGGETLEDAKNLFVREKVKQALGLAAGNRTKAAELLGVTPRTLFRYLEDFGGMTDLSV